MGEEFLAFCQFVNGEYFSEGNMMKTVGTVAHDSSSSNGENWARFPIGKNKVRFASLSNLRTVKFHRSWRHRAKPLTRYSAALLIVLAAFTFMASQEESLQSPSFLTPPFFCAIVLSCWFGGFGPGVVATFLSLLIIRYFYTLPLHELSLSTSEIPKFSVLLVCGIFISWLGGRQKADEASLIEATEELEERVQSRTADLREANERLTSSTEVLSRVAIVGRSTLQRLAEKPDFDTFIDHLLAICVEQFGATSVSVWLGDHATGICRQYIDYRRGDQRRNIRPSHEYNIKFNSLAESDCLLPKQGQIIIQRESDVDSLSFEEILPANLRLIGIRTIMRIPLFFGPEIRGIFSLHFTDQRTLTLEEEGLAHTLVNQVTLALELSRLSEQAKAAALADERNRMAADVHDTLGQAFAATLLHLRSMEMSGVDDTDLQTHWQFAQETAAAGLLAARRAINTVRVTAPANSRPLTERLAERVRQVSARSQARLLFTVKGDVAVLPWMVEDEFERLASESLFNAERHAAASEITLELDYSVSPGLRLCVRDNGRGFDPSNKTGSGFGLSCMHERAERIGATFTLITECSRGTEIVVSWMPEGTDGANEIAKEVNE